MNLTIPKLRHLWQNRSTIQKDDSLSHSQKRVAEILEIAAEWEAQRQVTAALTVDQSAEDARIPKDGDEGGWAAVMRDQLKFYLEREHLKGHTAHIDQVSRMLHVARRKAEYRVASQAPAKQQHETRSTGCERQAPNPESYLASYNHPFQVIQFYLGCREQQCPQPADEELPTSRFPYKFLWMVANRRQHLPIFSLQCFQNLQGILHELQPDQKWNDVLSGRWNLSLSDFAARWPLASEKLCREITGHDYGNLPDDKTRQELQKFVFLMSLHSTTTKNAYDMLQTGNQALILYGPPGTGKTFQAKKTVRQMLRMQDASKEAFEALQLGARDEVPDHENGCWELVQFHPSYSYQDFMGGILPSLDQKEGKLSYTLEEGVFMRFCKAAEKSEKPFVLIIDEINRADLSSVFGELMYALEYRSEGVQVPHFGRFKIPDNVFIIGTMNTTDKSLTSFDLALRRRFTFLKLPPDLECLMDWGTAKEGFSEQDMTCLIDRAKKLNEFLSDNRQGLSLAADYAIGQAYFMKVKDFCPMDDGRSLTPFALEQLWEYHLEPLIEEYLGADAANQNATIGKQRAEFTKTIPSSKAL